MNSYDKNHNKLGKLLSIIPSVHLHRAYYMNTISMTMARNPASLPLQYENTVSSEIAYGNVVLKTLPIQTFII